MFLSKGHNSIFLNLIMSKGGICNPDTRRLKQVLQFKLNTQDRARSSHSLLPRLKEHLCCQIMETEAPGAQRKAVTSLSNVKQGVLHLVVDLIFMIACL